MLDKMQPELQKQINGMFELSPTMTGSMNNHFSPQIKVTTYNNFETDPLGQMVNKVKTFQGGAKNDYSRGMA